MGRHITGRLVQEGRSQIFVTLASRSFRDVSCAVARHTHGTPFGYVVARFAVQCTLGKN